MAVLRRFAAAVAASALLAGCGPATPTDSAPLILPRAKAPLTYSHAMPGIAPQDLAARGRVLNSSEQTPFDMARLPAGTAAKTLTYQSISGISGLPTEVTGAVFVPPGTPPPGGWPMVGYAHFTVGITADCAPTEDPELRDSLSTVAALVAQGYAVAYTDYVGLGESGQIHPYLEPKSAAFNVIDSVRAARRIEPNLSDRWVALGTSQGGQAAFATAEYFPAYGEGTQLLGAAAVVPVLDISALVDSAQNATLTPDQLGVYPYVIVGLAIVDPAIDPNAYLHGPMRDATSAMMTCSGPGPDRGAMNAADAVPSSPQAVEALTVRLQSYVVPQQPTPVPLLVFYGGVDHIIAPQWTEASLDRACTLGDHLVRVRVDDAGHDLNPGAPLDRWIAERFHGLSAPSNC